MLRPLPAQQLQRVRRGKFLFSPPQSRGRHVKISCVLLVSSLQRHCGGENLRIFSTKQKTHDFRAGDSKRSKPEASTQAGEDGMKIAGSPAAWRPLMYITRRFSHPASTSISRLQEEPMATDRRLRLHINLLPCVLGLLFLSGINTLAQETRSTILGTVKDPTGNWAASGGRPVCVPKLYDGRDKLFFFFSYNAFKDVKTEEATQVNRTVPSDAHRRGDFSDLLRLDPVR